MSRCAHDAFLPAQTNHDLHGRGILLRLDEELAAEIKELGYWDHALCRDLCYRADMLDEFMATEEGNEELLLKAAEKLGVEIF